MSNQLAVFSAAGPIVSRGESGSGEQIHSVQCTRSQLRKHYGPKGLGLTSAEAKAKAEAEFAAIQTRTRQLVASMATDQTLQVGGFRFNEKTGTIVATMKPQDTKVLRGKAAKAASLAKRIESGEEVSQEEIAALLKSFVPKAKKSE